MTIAKDEIFGPVVAAFSFNNMDDLVRRANNTHYGLGSGIFSNDVNKIHTLASKLKAGNVWVNHYGGMHPSLPFGGMKQSGWGRELGEAGFRLFLEEKAVSIKLSNPILS